MMGGKLSIRNVSKTFDGLQAVRDISLDATAEHIVAVIGPNGAGKTTLFNCITGLVEADQSHIELQADEGEPAIRLHGKRTDEICRLGIARTFQQVRLFDSLSVVDNVMLGGLHTNELGWLPAVGDRLFRGARRHRALREAAETQLARVGLSNHRHDIAGNLDHGNRRRLEIARALASDPKVLLLDEPAAGMNRLETSELQDLLRLLRQEGLVILLIEHDMRLVMGISDIVYVMDHGEMLAAGTPAEVSANPKVVEAYLGRAASTHAAG